METLKNILRLSFLLSISSVVAGQPTADDALEKYMRCLSNGPLVLSDVQRRPVSPPFRPVLVDGLIRMVSVTAGVSATVSAAAGVPVLNMKLERSDPAVANRDRDIVRSQMRTMSDRRPTDTPAISEQIVGRVEVLALHESDVTRPIASFYSLFVEKTSAIVTIYVMGPQRGKGEFVSPAEFAKLRDEMVGGICACLE